MSIVLNIVERVALGGFTNLPMLRLGLANIVVLIVLYVYGTRDAFAVLILRIALVSLLYAGVIAFALSLSGGFLAFFLMWLFSRMERFTIVSVSVMGAIGHAVGQIMMAMFLLETEEIIFTLPIFLLMSVPTGIFTGLVARRLIRLMREKMPILRY